MTRNAMQQLHIEINENVYNSFLSKCSDDALPGLITRNKLVNAVEILTENINILPV